MQTNINKIVQRVHGQVVGKRHHDEKQHKEEQVKVKTLQAANGCQSQVDGAPGCPQTSVVDKGITARFTKLTLRLYSHD